MKHTLTVFIAIVVLLLAACTDTLTLSRLERAQRVMDSRPDSALAILDSINPDSLTSTEHKARYAVLAAQASFKNKIIPTDDSLLRIAVDYYKGLGDSAEMKALFYMGNVRYYCGFYASAIVPAMHARELAIKLGDDYWRAKSAEMLADIFMATHYDDTEIRKEAVEYYLKAGKIPNHRYAICDLATSYGQFRDYDRAFHLLDSIAKIAKSEDPVDTGLLSYCYDPLMSFYVKTNRFEEARQISTVLDSISDRRFWTAVDYAYRARMESNLGDYTKAKLDLDSARSIAVKISDYLLINLAYKDYYQTQNLLNEAIAYCDSMVDNIYDETGTTLSQSVITVQRDYYNELSEKEARFSNTLRIFIIILSSVLVLLLVAMFVIYRQRIRIKNNELDLKIKDISTLKAELENHKKAQQEYSSFIDDLLIDRLGLLDKLCNQYFENQNNDKSTVITGKKIENEIANLRSRYCMEEISRLLSPSDNAMIEKLTEQCPFLKDGDIHFISFLMVGLSAKATSILMDVSLKNFYTKRARIVERIRKSDAPDKDMFISKIMNLE